MQQTRSLGWTQVSVEIDNRTRTGSYRITDGLVEVSYLNADCRTDSKSTYLRGRGAYQTAQMLLMEFID